MATAETVAVSLGDRLSEQFIFNSGASLFDSGNVI